MGNMVEVNHVYKTFKKTNVLNNVSVQFAREKIHGVIGRNGSGKTVLFKCICGFMTPTAGNIIVDGKQVQPNVRQDIGIIIETPGFIESMSGYKNLMLLASIHKRISREEIKAVLLQVGLDPNMNKSVKHYSLGMRHRLAIAQAIMEQPTLLVLDEPMNGLDKQGVKEMRELFLELKNNGTTIILSSHYSEDIDALCDTVSEMDAGNLVRVR